MRSTNTVKVGAAFLAGLMLAVGGSFLYFKASDSHERPVTEIVAKEDAPVPSSVPESEPASEPAGPAPMKATTPKAAAAKTSPVKISPVKISPVKISAAKISVVQKAKISKPQVTNRPVSLEVPSQPPVTMAQTPPPPPSDSQQIAAVTAAPVAAPPPAHTVTIMAGTSLSVRLGEKLSTDQNFSGDTFRATLDTPIIMNGFIIAERGAKVLGRVVKAQKPGKLEGMAELSLVLTEVATTDGQKVAIATNQSLRRGPSNANEEVVKMAGGAALGAIIGALAGGGKGAAIGAGAGGAAGTGAVLLGKGKPAVIPVETLLTFALASPVTITEHLN